MLKAVNFIDQPLPRGLDESYHADLDNEKLDFLNNDQVIVRYIRYMKARYSRVLREIGYPTGHGSSDTEQMTSSHTHYEETESAPQLDQELTGVGDKGSASINNAGPIIIPKPISLHESDDFLTIPYF
ncbi:hypothetical protein QBC32DRAFT_104406 [Pseudoneurospora amorphoporcata]|uniref:Uncharacterized protein n=1 Tax=Pseudoneurospora amorphoporcata TaxID=241081 RepID=A0AAN6NJL7_9PEZI|nr:hypothetical protein QBC32DRAFT_104406 [Pseudoneurospora amorphoporcata]